LFASGDSLTRATLVPCCKQALRLDPFVRDHIPYFMIMLDKVRRMAPGFDVLHFHIDQFHFPSAAHTVTTLHGRQDLTDLQRLYVGFPDVPLVAISNAQRLPIASANFAGTVHHGIPGDLLIPTLQARGGYLAFLGRISPEKRVDRAIEIARAVGALLKIAAKVDRADQGYFETDIQPLLNLPGVEYIGEIGERPKRKFLGGAQALLFPIDWPEPFGLVMIEGMACGTLVLAFRHGSVPEVIDDGVTGYVVDTVDEALLRMGSLLGLNRGRVRRRFEERFSAARMARDYIRIYQSQLRARASTQHLAVLNGTVPELAAH